MKQKFLLLLLIIILLSSISCSVKKTDNAITVYAYDSFCSSWGPGSKIAEEFEKNTSVHVNLVSAGSGVELYSRILLEGSSCEADVAIGIGDFEQIDSNLFSKFTLDSSINLIPYDSSLKLVPFDWGIIAFNINKANHLEDYPACLSDLADPRYKNAFILIDPRTSSVGLSTLLWSIEVMGETKAFEWWKQVFSNALTIAPSWSMAYGLFTECEAPMVISYSTSPAYHIINKEDFETDILKFDEGHAKTVEYMGILSSSDNKEKAQQFCNFVLTYGQDLIAVSNTMLPANTNTQLPDAFDGLGNLKVLESKIKPSEISSLLDRFTEEVIDER